MKHIIYNHLTKIAAVAAVLAGFAMTSCVDEPDMFRPTDGVPTLYYIRPVDKYDIFNWRGKGKGQELKNVNRRSAPLQFIGPDGKVTDKNTIEAADTLPELLDSVAVEAADSSAAAPTVAAETADVPVAGHEAVPSGGEDGDGQPADAPKAVPASEVKAVKEE